MTASLHIVCPHCDGVNRVPANKLAASHNIRSIPTLALFKAGREVARQAGALDARSIVQWAKGQG